MHFSVIAETRNYIQYKEKENEVTLHNCKSLLTFQFNSEIKLTWMPLSHTGKAIAAIYRMWSSH